MSLARGDIVLGVLSGDFGKPRPMLVVQTDLLNPTHASVLVCPISSHLTHIKSFRMTILPESSNGLEKTSEIMIDKVSAISRSKLAQKIGALTIAEMRQVEQVLKFLFQI